MTACTLRGSRDHSVSRCPWPAGGAESCRSTEKLQVAQERHPPRTTPAMLAAVETALREAEEASRVIASIRACIDEIDRLPEPDIGRDPQFQF